MPLGPGGEAGQALRVVLAYNPASGNFCPEALGDLKSAFEGAGHEVSCENSREFCFERPVDLVCAYGGDGTARTVVSRNGADAAGAPLCVFPSGTINLLAREARYASDVAGFARMAAERMAGEVGREVHFGHIGEEAFLCCASVGPDARAVAAVSERLKRRIGRLAYGVAALAQMWRWPRQAFEFTVDGASLRGEAMFVCKGRYYAGPWVIDEAAALSNDHFRILILPRAGRRDLLRLALSAVFHPSLGDARWHRLSGRTITVASDAPAPIQADGDIVAQTPATIAMAPFPLTFL